MQSHKQKTKCPDIVSKVKYNNNTRICELSDAKHTRATTRNLVIIVFSFPVFVMDN